MQKGKEFEVFNTIPRGKDTKQHLHERLRRWREEELHYLLRDEIVMCIANKTVYEPKRFQEQAASSTNGGERRRIAGPGRKERSLDL